MLKSTYINQITEQINLVTESCGPVLLFGENIDTGSRIAGLARGLKVNPSGTILNVGNCELTHCGVGLGMMLDGGNAVLYMKQLDFLLLGIDQLVNTYNFIRAYHSPETLGSFTVYPIVCDQGYQGPQSSLNSAADFASLANIDVYCLNSQDDAAFVIGENFVSPGLRIICTSQRLFGEPALDLPVLARSSRSAVFKYKSGDDVTVVCYNFALRQGLEFVEQLQSSGLHADLFHSNFIPGMDMEMLIESCRRTGKLVIVDDSKTVTKFGDILVGELSKRGLRTAVNILSRRGSANEDYGVGADQFKIDHDAAKLFVQSA
jgi:pyruvate/2-oxoglutarate/acetoin dehydrogenase E1 component